MSYARRTLNLGDFYEFAIEWQEVTGRLLMMSERTREDGEAKLRDAEERREMLDSLVEKGVL